MQPRFQRDDRHRSAPAWALCDGLHHALPAQAVADRDWGVILPFTAADHDPSQIEPKQLHHRRLIAPVSGDGRKGEWHGAVCAVADGERELTDLSLFDREVHFVDHEAHLRTVSHAWVAR